MRVSPIAAAGMLVLAVTVSRVPAQDEAQAEKTVTVWAMSYTNGGN